MGAWQHVKGMNRFIRFFAACATQHAKIALAASVAACCGLVACGFIIVSIWIYAIPIVGPAGAPLIAAVPLAIGCLIGCLVANRFSRSSPSLPPSPLPDLAVAAAARLLQERPATALLATAIAGLLVGIAQPKR